MNKYYVYGLLMSVFCAHSIQTMLKRGFVPSGAGVSARSAVVTRGAIPLLTTPSTLESTRDFGGWPGDPRATAGLREKFADTFTKQGDFGSAARVFTGTKKRAPIFGGESLGDALKRHDLNIGITVLNTIDYGVDMAKKFKTLTEKEKDAALQNVRNGFTPEQQKIYDDVDTKGLLKDLSKEDKLHIEMLILLGVSGLGLVYAINQIYQAGESIDREIERRAILMIGYERPKSSPKDHQIKFYNEQLEKLDNLSAKTKEMHKKEIDQARHNIIEERDLISK